MARRDVAVAVDGAKQGISASGIEVGMKRNRYRNIAGVSAGERWPQCMQDDVHSVRARRETGCPKSTRRYYGGMRCYRPWQEGSCPSARSQSLALLDTETWPSRTGAAPRRDYTRRRRRGWLRVAAPCCYLTPHWHRVRLLHTASLHTLAPFSTWPATFDYDKLRADLPRYEKKLNIVKEALHRPSSAATAAS